MPNSRPPYHRLQTHTPGHRRPPRPHTWHQGGPLRGLWLSLLWLTGIID